MANSISFRTKILISIVLIVVLAVVLFFITRERPQMDDIPVDVLDTPITIQEERRVSEEVDEPIIIPEAPDAIAAQTATTIFVERFASYSSQANLQNIEDVLGLVTDSYASELQAFIDETRANESSDGYYGVTTRVISTTEISFDEEVGLAQYTVTTQREESVGSPTNTSIYYQDMVVSLEKQGDNWYVSSAVWWQ